MCCFVYNNILEERNKKKSRGADLLLPRQSKWSILFITAKSSFVSRSAELNIVNSCGSFEKWGDIFKKKMDPELSAPVVVFTLLPRSYLLRVASYFALKLLCGNVRAELASCNTSVAVCALL